MPKILLLNGADLKLLGSRETDDYGRATPTDAQADMTTRAAVTRIDLATCHWIAAQHTHTPTNENR